MADRSCSRASEVSRWSERDLDILKCGCADVASHKAYDDDQAHFFVKVVRVIRLGSDVSH